jgi:hypothetical protein
MRYTVQQLSFIRRAFLRMPARQIPALFSKKFGVSRGYIAIKSCITNHGFSCGRPPGNQAGTLRLLSKKQDRFIRKNYSRFPLTQLTARLNEKFGSAFTLSQVRCYTRNHRIKSGRSGRFEKGLIPWNSGTKGMGICKGNSGNFKKGHIPANKRRLGSERIDSKDGYIMIKVRQHNPYTGLATRYRQKHVVVWERHNGPVPKGMCVFFKDQNKKNCSIRNLVLVTRSELVRLNQVGYARVADSLKPSVLALSKLRVKIFERAKTHK